MKALESMVYTASALWDDIILFLKSNFMGRSPDSTGVLTSAGSTVHVFSQQFPQK
jgi:hypothetical protein